MINDGKNIEMNDIYKCSLCGLEFKYVINENWSEEHAKKEYEQLFPNAKWEDRKIICDDCWKEIKPSRPIWY